MLVVVGVLLGLVVVGQEDEQGKEEVAEGFHVPPGGLLVVVGLVVVVDDYDDVVFCQNKSLCAGRIGTGSCRRT